MLQVYRRLTLSIQPDQLEEIRYKLNEFGIFPISEKYKDRMNGIPFERVYLDINEPINKTDRLMAYLENDFKGIASVTY